MQLRKIINGAVLAVLLISSLPSIAQKTIPLYNGPIPNAIVGPNNEVTQGDHSSVAKVSVPTLTVYLPDKQKANGTAVIICPGGGYHNLVIDREGFKMAKRLVDMGIAAFVLKYRLPSDDIMKDKSTGPLQDVQQAIYSVRGNASKWHIDTAKVGVMGFSAGGHLASTIGTHYRHSYINNKENISLRPDFLVLVYPVISFRGDIAHIGSRTNLIGASPSDALIKAFSNDEQVTPQTPPAFIVQAEDDSIVNIENSIRYYEAMVKNKVKGALHIYTVGGHGFIKVPPRDVWMPDLIYWMQTMGWLPTSMNP